MTNHKVDAILNRIVIDSCLLIGITLLGLLIFGTIHEHGDTNAGSMYGLFIIPLTPLIIVSMVMVELAKRYFNFYWVGSLMPLFLSVFGIWLDHNRVPIFIATIVLVVLYSVLKPAIKVILK